MKKWFISLGIFPKHFALYKAECNHVVAMLLWWDDYGPSRFSLKNNSAHVLTKLVVTAGCPTAVISPPWIRSSLIGFTYSFSCPLAVAVVSISGTTSFVCSPVVLLLSPRSGWSREYPRCLPLVGFGGDWLFSFAIKEAIWSSMRTRALVRHTKKRRTPFCPSLLSEGNLFLPGRYNARMYSFHEVHLVDIGTHEDCTTEAQHTYN